MNRRAIQLRTDIGAVVLLVACGILIGWPALTGGYAWYLDNPAHLAEVRSLAGEGRDGWSDIAWCGFAVEELHAPLLYQGLALAQRAGLPAGGLYAALLLVSFCAPAVAFYGIARSSVSVLPALLAAFLLLVQRPAIAGTASAFGGMWTFYLAAAGAVILAGLLARPRHARLPWIAAVVALIGLTHLMVALAALLLCLIHLCITGWRMRATAMKTAGAITLGFAGAAAYWGPHLLARDAERIFRWDVSPLATLQLLLLPVDVDEVLLGFPWASRACLYTDAFPLLALLALGLGGLAALRRRDDGGEARRLALLGGVWAALLFALLLAAEALPYPLLGPISWRQIYFVRIGLALGSLPLLQRWGANRAPSPGQSSDRVDRGPAGGDEPTAPSGLPPIAGASRPALPALSRRAGLLAFLLPLALPALSWLWGAPLRAHLPSAAAVELREVRAFWDRVRASSTDSWGRVYLQDTFMTGDPDAAFFRSHILARTSAETGIRQVGAYYGAVPHVTSRWTGSLLLGPAAEPARRASHLLRGLRAANATHLVACAGEESAFLSTLPELRSLWSQGRYTLFEVRGERSDWAVPITEGMQTRTSSYRAGEIRIDLRNDRPNGGILVKESWHPGWRHDGPSARLSATPDGLMRCDGLPPGARTLTLAFRPARWPVWVSAMAGIVVLAWVAGTTTSAKRRRWTSSGGATAGEARPDPTAPPGAGRGSPRLMTLLASGPHRPSLSSSWPRPRLRSRILGSRPITHIHSKSHPVQRSRPATPFPRMEGGHPCAS